MNCGGKGWSQGFQMPEGFLVLLAAIFEAKWTENLFWARRSRAL